MTSSSEKKDDTIPVPCGHCASVSIDMPAQRGRWTLMCPKCGFMTRFDVELGLGGLEVRSRAVEKPSPPETD